MAASSGTYLKYSAVGGGGGGSAGSAGIKSINADTTTAQLIAGANGISVNTAAGTTTITGSSAAGTGTVTSVGITSNNGFSGTVAASSTVASITLLTTVSGVMAASSGGVLSAAASSSFPTLNQNTSGTASGLSGSNLSGDVTNSGNATTVAKIQGYATTATYSIPPIEFDAGIGSSGTFFVNWINGAAQTISVKGTFSAAFNNGVPGGTYLLRLVSSGANTVNFPTSAFVWPNSVIPNVSATSGYVDLISLYYGGDSKYYATASTGLH